MLHQSDFCSCVLFKHLANSEAFLESGLFSELRVAGFTFYSEAASSFMEPAIVLSQKVDALGWDAAIVNEDCIASWRNLLVDCISVEYERFFRSIIQIEDISFLDGAASLYDHFILEINQQQQIDNRYAQYLGLRLAFIFEKRESLFFTKQSLDMNYEKKGDAFKKIVTKDRFRKDSLDKWRELLGYFSSEHMVHSLFMDNQVSQLSSILVLPCKTSLTFYDIAWGMIQTPPVWPLGLVPSHLMADGQKYGVLDFYGHDLIHLKNCYKFMMDMSHEGDYFVSKDYLDFSKGCRIGITQQLFEKHESGERLSFYRDVMAAIFLYFHETPPVRFETSVENICVIAEEQEYSYFIIRRFFDDDNLAALLPTDLKSLLNKCLFGTGIKNKRDFLKKISRSFNSDGVVMTDQERMLYSMVLDWRDDVVSKMKSCFPNMN